MTPTAELTLVNGGPGIITHDTQGNIVSVLSLEELDGVIQTVRSVVTPDQLGSLVALIALIALINAFNRLIVIARRPAVDYQPGQWD